MEGTNSVIHIEDLTMAYRDTPVLWDIDLDVPECVRCAIAGPNGAGKSTLLKGILGLLKPVSGAVLLWGKPLSAVHKQIAYVPQRGSVHWDFPTTVFDVVLMGRYAHLGLVHRPGKEDRALAMEALDKMKMADFADRQISELSGGRSSVSSSRAHSRRTHSSTSWMSRLRALMRRRNASSWTSLWIYRKKSARSSPSTTISARSMPISTISSC